jgi:putative membrane protein
VTDDGSTPPAGEPRRLHPATLIVRWLRIVPQMLGGGAAYGFATAREAPGRILLFVGIGALIGVAVALLAWWRFRYTVGAGEIVIESGILRRQRRVIPYDRVQDVAIERRLLARLFGTAKVRIETGGSAADEGDLDMISLADAHALRDRLRRRALSARAGEGKDPQVDGGGVAAFDLSESEPVLFELTLGRLLYSGLFNFSLLFLAAIFAIVQNLEQIGMVSVEDWLTPERAESAQGYFNVRLALLLIPLLVLLGLVSGVARTVARDFGFRLTRSEGGLRRRRGLFTLSEVVIPLRRTQVAVIDSGPVGRWLGWYSLSFETLGADLKEGGVQVAAPFARMEELLPILAVAGFPAPPPRPGFAHAPRRALVRWAGQYLVVGLIAVAAALIFEPWVGVAAGLMLLFAVYGLLHWRKHSHALGERALFVSRGLLKRRLSIIPFERTQTISVWRGPLQRRLRLATLLVDSAGAPLMRPPEIVDLDSGEAEALSDRLLSLFYQARGQTREKR